jgi:hypothetical protein
MPGFTFSLENIDEAKYSATCETALENFRKYLKDSKENVITGQHFYVDLLIEALKEYQRNGLNSKTIYYSKLVYLLQLEAPACLAQALASGLSNIIVGDWYTKADLFAPNRSFQFRGLVSGYFYPDLSAHSSIITEDGFYFKSSPHTFISVHRMPSFLRVLSAQKSAAYNHIMNSIPKNEPDKKTGSSCSVM